MRTPAEVFPPGDFIREELEERGWTQRDLAAILGRPVPFVNMLITGKVNVTPDTARELAEAFGTSAEFWARLDAAYRLSLATDPRGRVRERAQLFELAPIKEMQKRQWIRKTSDPHEIERELKRFYGVGSLEEIRVAARASTSGEHGELTPFQHAWCRRGVQLAQHLQVKRHTRATMRAGIEKLRGLLRFPEDVRMVPRILGEMGIRFVVIEHLPKTKIDGAALWVDNVPVVLMSMRYDRIDYFWLTLAHELDHIDKGDGTRIDTDYGEPTTEETERRANRNAANWLIPESELVDFIARVSPYYSKEKIVRFATRIKVHPGLVAGQLQHRGEIKYAANREMLVKVRDIVIAEAATDGWGHTPSL